MNIDFESRLKPLIKEARARGVTDVDMEVAMALPVHSINRWFRGINKSYDRYADRLADYFDVSKHYLYGIDAENPPPVGDGLVDKISALAQSPGLLEELNRFLELAAEDPETARRFLAFAVQELQSSRPLR